MKQQSQVNSGDIHTKVGRRETEEEKKVKEMSFESFEKDRRRKGKYR
jgi:hypothetical protein